MCWCRHRCMQIHSSGGENCGRKQFKSSSSIHSLFTRRRRQYRNKRDLTLIIIQPPTQQSLVELTRRNFESAASDRIQKRSQLSTHNSDAGMRTRVIPSTTNPLTNSIHIRAHRFALCKYWRYQQQQDDERWTSRKLKCACACFKYSKKCFFL